MKRTRPLKNERQLDGSACESLDCGPASVVTAIDDASYGLIRPTTEQVRKKMGAKCRTTNAWDWQRAIEGFSDRFEREGLHPPKTRILYGVPLDKLDDYLERGGVIGAIHYGTLARIKPSLWSSRTYKGNHAVYFRTIRENESGREVPTYDPLADGRFRGIPNGRRVWPFSVVKKTAGNVRNSNGTRIYPEADKFIGLLVQRARPIGEPDPGIELPPEPDREDVLSDEVLHDHISWLESQRDAITLEIDKLGMFTDAPNESDSEGGEGVDLEDKG